MDKKRQLAGKKRLTPQIREKMFLIYSETKSLQKVKKTLGLHRKTVERVRERDHWDERLGAIEKATHQRVDNKITNRRLRNVRLIDKVLEQLEGQLDLNRLDIDIRSLPALVKIQDHLIATGAAEEEVMEITPEVQAAIDLLSKLPARTLEQLGAVMSDRIGAQVEDTDALSTVVPERPGALVSVESGQGSELRGGRKPRQGSGKGRRTHV